MPSGSDGIVTFLDQNNVGQINGSGVIGDANDTITDTLTISGGSQNVGNFNLPTAGSYAVVGTQYSSNTCQGCSPATTTSYSLNFDVEGLDKLPVAVTLAGASNLNVLNNAGTVALDMSICNDCGNAQFEYSITLLGGTPNVGDTYTFNVTYSDSSGLVTGHGNRDRHSDGLERGKHSGGSERSADEPVAGSNQQQLQHRANLYLDVANGRHHGQQQELPVLSVA